MRPVTFLQLLLPLLLVCLLPAAGWSGVGYDACHEEEQRLQAAETEQCSGVMYFLNPSACFNTRKALAPYLKGKCREIAASEGNVEQVSPAAAAPPVQLPDAAAVSTALPVQSQLSSGRTGGDAASPTEIEQLRIDIEKLREELQRLKEEVIRHLRK